MSDVKRWMLTMFTNRGGEPDAKMTVTNDGWWVTYKDYAAKEAEVKEWQIRAAFNRSVAMGGEVWTQEAEDGAVETIRNFRQMEGDDGE